MKVILYRDGKPGVVVSLPGEYPEEELGELLGGETVMSPITARLMLVTIREETADKPAHYLLERLGQEARQVPGDAAVVAVRPDGVLTDITVKDVVAMEGRMTWAG